MGHCGATLRWCASRPDYAAVNLQAVGYRVAKDHLPRARAKEGDSLQREQLPAWFGTLAEWVECPTGVVAQITGHKLGAIAEKHYRRRPLDLLRMWHVRIEAFMLEQAGIAHPTEDEQKLRLVIAA